MFEQWVGKAVFHAGVRAYLKTNEWSNATAQDFWAALSRASKVDMAAAMSTYFEKPGVPLVTARPLGGGRVELTQRRFLNFGVDEPSGRPPVWHIPVALRWSDGSTVRTHKVLLKETSRTIQLPETRNIEWIHPNAGEYGFYRWSVPADMLTKLVDVASQALSDRERVALAGHLAALMDAGQIRGDDYLKTLPRLAADPLPEVVSAVAGGLGKVRSAFVTSELEDPFAMYVRRTLGPALQRIGRTKTRGEPEMVTMLRPTLLRWLGDDGQDRAVRDFALTTAKKYFDDPTSVDPAVAGTCLRLAALEGDRKLYDSYKKKFESARVPAERSRYLSALGCFQKPDIIEDALAYALSGPLRVHELTTIPRSVAGSIHLRDRVFKWVTDNYEQITSRVPPSMAAYTPYFASGCSAERLAAARIFFGVPAHQVPGTERQLSKVAESITDCVSLREREGKAVREYLIKLYAGE